MTVNGHRPTADPAHRTAAATVAASEARRRRAARRRASEFRKQLGLLDGDWIQALAAVLVAECRQRGLTVPDLLQEEDEQRER